MVSARQCALSIHGYIADYLASRYYSDGMSQAFISCLGQGLALRIAVKTSIITVEELDDLDWALALEAPVTKTDRRTRLLHE
jgi:hypothetical protein